MSLVDLGRHSRQFETEPVFGGNHSRTRLVFSDLVGALNSMQHWLRKLAQDRLVWFVILGGLLFEADWLVQLRDDKIIKVDLPLVQKLVAQWEGQTERRPNAR